MNDYILFFKKTTAVSARPRGFHERESDRIFFSLDNEE